MTADTSVRFRTDGRAKPGTFVKLCGRLRERCVTFGYGHARDVYELSVSTGSRVRRAGLQRRSELKALKAVRCVAVACVGLSRYIAVPLSGREYRGLRAVVAGDHDFTSIEETTEIFRGLPQAQLFLVQGTGHGTYQDRPKLVNLAVGEFRDQPDSLSFLSRTQRVTELSGQRAATADRGGSMRERQGPASCVTRDLPRSGIPHASNSPPRAAWVIAATPGWVMRRSTETA